MKIVLSTESSADLPKALQEKYDVAVIPFTVIKGEETVIDGIETLENLYDYTEKSGKLPRTSAVNVAEYQAHFAKLLEEGDEVIHVAISHKISSANANAFQAAESFGGKVHVIDSMHFHTGQGLAVLYVRALIDQGKSVPEILEIMEKRIPYISTTATLETVRYLYKGGRCNALALLGANLLRLRPMVEIQDGELHLVKKFRGLQKKWTVDYTDYVLETKTNPDKHIVFISNTSEMPEAVEYATKRLKELGFENIYFAKAGATIGTHTGPGTFSIEFYNDGPHEW